MSYNFPFLQYDFGSHSAEFCDTDVMLCNISKNNITFHIHTNWSISPMQAFQETRKYTQSL